MVANVIISCALMLAGFGLLYAQVVWHERRDERRAKMPLGEPDASERTHSAGEPRSVGTRR